MRGRIAGGSSTAHRRLHRSGWGAGVVFCLRTVVRLPQRPWERTSERANEARSASERACERTSVEFIYPPRRPAIRDGILHGSIVFLHAHVRHCQCQKPVPAKKKETQVQILGSNSPRSKQSLSPCSFQGDAGTVYTRFSSSRQGTKKRDNLHVNDLPPFPPDLGPHHRNGGGPPPRPNGMMSGCTPSPSPSPRPRPRPRPRSKSPGKNPGIPGGAIGSHRPPGGR